MKTGCTTVSKSELEALPWVRDLKFVPSREFTLGSSKPMLFTVASLFMLDSSLRPPACPGLPDDLYGIYAKPAELDVMMEPDTEVLLCFPPIPGEARHSNIQPSLLFWRDAFWTHALDIGYDRVDPGLILDIIYQVRVLNVPSLTIDQLLAINKP